MNIQGFPPELIAHCVYDRSKNTAFKNAMALSFVSKVFYKVINSDDFLKSLVGLQGSSIQDVITVSKLFKHRYEELRTYCDKETRSVFSNISFEKALIWGNLEVYSSPKEIQRHFLMENKEFTMTWPDNSDLQNPSFAPYEIVRSEDYLIIANQCLEFLTPDGLKCIAKCKNMNKVRRLYVVDNRLYVVNHTDNHTNGSSRYRLIVFNLKNIEETPLECSLPSSYTIPDLYFSENHLVYARDLGKVKRPITIPLSCLKNEGLKISWTEGYLVGKEFKYFPYENGFLEVSFTEDASEISVSKFSITKNGHARKHIMKLNGYFEEDQFDIHLQDDRLFIGGVVDGKNKIFSYDLISKTINAGFTIPNTTKYNPDSSFKPVFLTQADKIHYLSKERVINHRPLLSNGRLTTLNFKI